MRSWAFRRKITAIVMTVAALWATGPSAARGAGVNEELSQAAMRGDAPAMQRLIARGAKVNAKEKSGWTALMLASQSGVSGRLRY